MMEIYFDVVDINVPLLLGPDRLDEHKLYVNNIKEILVCVEPKWSHLIMGKLGLLFYEWKKDVFCTDNEPKRLHQHLYHSNPENIFN